MSEIRERIEGFVDEKIDSLFTAAIAKVDSVDWNDWSADVKLKGVVDGEEFPVWRNVPLVMPQTSGGQVLLPLSSGDTVLLVFTKYDLYNMIVDGQIRDVDFNQFSQNNVLAIPGVFLGTDSKPNYDGSGVKVIANKVVVESGDVALGGEAGKKVARKGDEVQVSTSTGVGSITEGSSKVSSE